MRHSPKRHADAADRTVTIFDARRASDIHQKIIYALCTTMKASDVTDTLELALQGIRL